MANSSFMNIAAPNQWQVQQQGWDYLPLDAPLWPYPWQYNAELTGGWAGFGAVWEGTSDMWVCIVFAFVWFAARGLSKRLLFPPLAVALGMNPKKKKNIAKFSYNMWLLAFYTSSALVGYFVILPGEKYNAFPVDARSGEAMFNYHPVPIGVKTHWYYMYQLGFYIAELYAIFVEPKRSDFVEYVLHHLVTIVLIGLSYVAREHRVGANIILMHDVPDVFLCAAKMCNYIKADKTSFVMFGSFAASFAFLRLYCLPKVSYVIFFLAPQFHPATTSYWILAILLGVVLQALHVFWFIMIIKLIYRLLFVGDPKDPRSDDEAGEPSTPGVTPQKPKVKLNPTGVDDRGDAGRKKRS